jgi:hypothetical protein
VRDHSKVRVFQRGAIRVAAFYRMARPLLEALRKTVFVKVHPNPENIVSIKLFI